MIKHKLYNRGSVLLIAILVGGAALAIGLGVYERTYKEMLFASFWKQTQIAFAAADSGIECALYWELHPTPSASCFGAVIAGWDPIAQIGSFTVDVGAQGGCVNVIVAMEGTATTTTARGYNTSCAATSTNPRVVERGLKISI
ncbi:MAG: hypothetical protein WC791_00355 [Candidatus Paceibacterota bacterium]|jgi:hypothetical protein